MVFNIIFVISINSIVVSSDVVVVCKTVIVVFQTVSWLVLVALQRYSFHVHVVVCK